MEKIILSGMPEPMLQPLYARAKESQTHGALHDDTAVRLVQQLDYNFDFSSKDAAMHNGVIARALVLDKPGFYLPGAASPAAVVTLPATSPCFLLFLLIQQTQYFLSDTPHHGPPTLFFIFYIIHSKSGLGCLPHRALLYFQFLISHC